MILVTGGAGFIGTNLCKQLVELGKDVISMDDYSSGKINNHIEGVQYISSDCRHIDQLPFGSPICVTLTPGLFFIKLLSIV